MENKQVVITDQVGRTIIGTQVAETDTTLSLYNPVILYVQLQENGQLGIQTFPLFFFEFLDKDNKDKNTWVYNKANIVTSDVTLNAEMKAQYARINTPAPAQPEISTNPKVISINDI